jgi:hypothetical protein
MHVWKLYARRTGRAFEQNPDCFSPHFGHRFAFFRFLDHQSYGPACTACWRITANHGDNALPLAVVRI